MFCFDLVSLIDHYVWVTFYYCFFHCFLFVRWLAQDTHALLVN